MAQRAGVDRFGQLARTRVRDLLAGAVAGAACTGATTAVSAFGVSILGVSILVASILGASILLGSTLCASSLAGSVLVGSGIGAAATGSTLKSAAVGGGTLAGSGRGTAASIARSAAALRNVPLCARAELADTVRNVAATVIKTRSYPLRFFQQSRIITPLG